MLNLCLAHPVFYPTFGGGSLRFLRYQPGLHKRDVQTRVLAGTSRAKDASHPHAEHDWNRYAIGTMLPVESIEAVPVHRVRLPDETSVRRTSIYFRALIELCRAAPTRPDVIQLHSFERIETLFWLPLLRRLDIPIVYAIQISSPMHHDLALISALHRQMLRRFYGSFDGVVTSSEQIAGQLRRLGVETPIAFIPNGVDLARYRPQDDAARREARARIGIRGAGPVLLSVGAVSPRKGSDLLLEAWNRLLPRFPDLEVVLVGPRHDLVPKKEGRFEARIADLVARSGRPDRVHFLGVRDDVDALYAAADLVVLPTSREGGTPNVVLEAMACGVPVLLTPFDGQSTAIGRPGIEFAQCARTSESLTRTIGELLTLGVRRSELALRGRIWVRDHLGLDRTLDRFADFYERAAARSLEAAELDAENPTFPTLPTSIPSRRPRSGP
jgi:glycosyltransferase involved in cell wall biosynthesis